MRLRGKHKPTFTPRMSTAATTSSSSTPTKVVLTGRKLERKVYHHHTGFIGGIKERTAQARSWKVAFPERIVEKAVERMLPRGPLGRQQLEQSACLSKVRSIRTTGAAAREVVDIANMNRKNTRSA